MRIPIVAAIGLGLTAAVLRAPMHAAPAAAVEFKPHVIEAKMPGGYAVLVVDMNKDGKPDVIGVSQRVAELAWYENPTWERHVIADGMTAMVNLAAADIDGDGIPEIAVETAFAMVPANSEGLVWLVRHQGDPAKPWKIQQIDKFSTSHHIAWADIDGDGKKELINAPLVGPLGAAPTYDQDKASLFWYRQTDWQRRVIATDIGGILHRVRPVNWDGNGREQLLATSFDGIALYRASGTGANVKWERRKLSAGHEEKAPRLGASDVAVGRANGKRFLASVEPWHGNEIVVYNEDASGAWTRTVLFNEMVEGHEVAVADFNGDGRDDIVAGDRNAKGATVHVMYAPDSPNGSWRHQPIDAGAMAASGCVTADINNDRRPDIVCIGSSTGNIKWYENVGTAQTSASVAPAANVALAAAKDGPIVYGHHHLNTNNVEAQKKFFVDTLGGSTIKIGTTNTEIVRFPNVLIFFRANQTPTGGTRGSTVNHIGFSVPNLRQVVDKIKAGGYTMITNTEADASRYDVKDDIAVARQAGGLSIAFAQAPDDVKVELLENKQQTMPIALHHVHFFNPKNTEMHEWYVKTFGAKPRTGGAFPAADLPGVALNFSQSPTPVAGTQGRALDHIGFEIKNLEEFCRKLEADGVKLAVPYRKIPALDIAIAFFTDPWGTYIELTEGLNKIP